jgi:hypothetical protein
MKLSKHKLNKIKVRKDNSRKKKHLRRNKKKFENSKKKHNRKSHLKNKTLKIYFGGANEDCQFKNIPTEQKKNIIKIFTDYTLVKKIEFLNQYYDPMKNLNCLQDAHDNLLDLLQKFYRKNPTTSETDLVDLKDVWEQKLDPTTLTPEKRTSLALNLNDITGKKTNVSEENQLSDEERQQQQAQYMKALDDFCKSINPITDTNIYHENINAISNKIKAKSTKALIIKSGKLIRKIGNIDLYAVETTAEGECMYSSFIYGMLLKQVKNVIIWEI